jgi:hypothetical protein
MGLRCTKPSANRVGGGLRLSPEVIQPEIGDNSTMSSARPEDGREKWQQFLSLIEFSRHLMRVGLRDRHPEASEEEIERMFQAWWMKEDDDEGYPPTMRRRITQEQE